MKLKKQPSKHIQICPIKKLKSNPQKTNSTQHYQASSTIKPIKKPTWSITSFGGTQETDSRGNEWRRRQREL
jgi:hypothetical protein